MLLVGLGFETSVLRDDQEMDGPSLWIAKQRHLSHVRAQFQPVVIRFFQNAARVR